MVKKVHDFECKLRVFLLFVVQVCVCIFSAFIPLFFSMAISLTFCVSVGYHMITSFHENYRLTLIEECIFSYTDSNYLLIPSLLS